MGLNKIKPIDSLKESKSWSEFLETLQLCCNTGIEGSLLDNNTQEEIRAEVESTEFVLEEVTEIKSKLPTLNVTAYPDRLTLQSYRLVDHIQFLEYDEFSSEFTLTHVVEITRDEHTYTDKYVITCMVNNSFDCFIVDATQDRNTQDKLFDFFLKLSNQYDKVVIASSFKFIGHFADFIGKAGYDSSVEKPTIIVNSKGKVYVLQERTSVSDFVLCDDELIDLSEPIEDDKLSKFVWSSRSITNGQIVDTKSFELPSIENVDAIEIKGYVGTSDTNKSSSIVLTEFSGLYSAHSCFIIDDICYFIPFNTKNRRGLTNLFSKNKGKIGLYLNGLDKVIIFNKLQELSISLPQGTYESDSLLYTGTAFDNSDDLYVVTPEVIITKVDYYQNSFSGNYNQFGKPGFSCNSVQSLAKLLQLYGYSLNDVNIDTRENELVDLEYKTQVYILSKDAKSTSLYFKGLVPHGSVYNQFVIKNISFDCKDYGYCNNQLVVYHKVCTSEQISILNSLEVNTSYEVKFSIKLPFNIGGFINKINAPSSIEEVLKTSITPTIEFSNRESDVNFSKYLVQGTKGGAIYENSIVVSGEGCVYFEESTLPDWISLEFDEVYHKNGYTCVSAPNTIRVKLTANNTSESREHIINFKTQMGLIKQLRVCQSNLNISQVIITDARSRLEAYPVYQLITDYLSVSFDFIVDSGTMWSFETYKILEGSEISENFGNFNQQSGEVTPKSPIIFRSDVDVNYESFDPTVYKIYLKCNGVKIPLITVGLIPENEAKFYLHTRVSPMKNEFKVLYNTETPNLLINNNSIWILGLVLDSAVTKKQQGDEIAVSSWGAPITTNNMTGYSEPFKIDRSNYREYNHEYTKTGMGTLSASHLDAVRSIIIPRAEGVITNAAYTGSTVSVKYSMLASYRDTHFITDILPLVEFSAHDPFGTFTKCFTDNNVSIDLGWSGYGHKYTLSDGKEVENSDKWSISDSNELSLSIPIYSSGLGGSKLTYSAIFEVDLTTDAYLEITGLAFHSMGSVNTQFGISGKICIYAFSDYGDYEVLYEAGTSAVPVVLIPFEVLVPKKYTRIGLSFYAPISHTNVKISIQSLSLKAVEKEYTKMYIPESMIEDDSFTMPGSPVQLKVKTMPKQDYSYYGKLLFPQPTSYKSAFPWDFLHDLRFVQQNPDVYVSSTVIIGRGPLDKTYWRSPIVNGLRNANQGRIYILSYPLKSQEDLDMFADFTKGNAFSINELKPQSQIQNALLEKIGNLFRRGNYNVLECKNIKFDE